MIIEERGSDEEEEGVSVMNETMRNIDDHN
jgi:hypothetical protein